MRKILPLFAFFLLPATSFSQVPLAHEVDNLHRYVATCAATGAGSVAKCAISVPATGSKRAFLDTIIVRSTAATDVVFERGGSAPTTTAQTSTKLNTTQTSQLTVYQDANSGAGTSTTTLKIGTADTDFAFDMKGEAFEREVETTLVVKSASMTGTFTVIFFWGEAQ
jgi:hypothetical protein